MKLILDNNILGSCWAYRLAHISFRHGAGDPRTAHDESENNTPSNSAITNCLFVDGHVESPTFGDLRKTYDDAGVVGDDLAINSSDDPDCLKVVRGKGYKKMYDVTTIQGVTP